jgi:hypothetical protein
MPPSFLALALVFAAAISIQTPVSVQVADELAGRRLEYLAARSATMKQILEVLQRTPAISVRLRANPMLWRETSRKAAGRFWRGGARVIVLLQFDSASARPIEQIESVAHEMAHAVEVACLPRAIEIDGLVGQMLRRGRPVASAKGLAVETPFAQHAGREMFTEALRGRPGIGRLRELAEKYSLGPPCVDLAREARTVTASKIGSSRMAR